MEKLLIRHYNACIKRGVITPKTSFIDFVKKIEEEDKELLIEINKETPNYKLTESVIRETIDSIMVRLNMLRFYYIDIEKELLKNILVQEKRAKLNK